MKRPGDSQPLDARTLLAFGITTAAVIGITILAWVTIATTDPNVNQRAQNVLSSVLPLFGTWVGTVLAYYFARENFVAASNSTQDIYRSINPNEKLPSTPVKSVMTSVKNIKAVRDLNTKVTDALDDLEAGKIVFKRLPILDASDSLTALMYADAIRSYLLGVDEAARRNMTIDDLLKAKPDLRQPPAYVSETATLAEAKAAMEKIDNCKVVIVTKTGDPKEPILGMLTATNIGEYSRA